MWTVTVSLGGVVTSEGRYHNLASALEVFEFFADLGRTVSIRLA